MEKLVASIAGALSIGLGIWARITFVRRSEIYAKNGQPVYQHTVNCKEMQQLCNKTICKKIDELKAVQDRAEKNRDEDSRAIQNHMGRVEQYMKDHQ